MAAIDMRTPAPRSGRGVHDAVVAVAVMGVLLLLARAHVGIVGDAIAALAFVMFMGLGAVLSPTLDYALVDRPMESLVAFVGCDGSGKSTLTGDISRTFAGSLPVRICYLGLGSGAIGAAIARLPIAGPAIERRLARKATQTRTKDAKIPGLATAIVVYLFSLLRLHRFKRMLRLRRDGFVVLTDRYPQTEFAGTYDGPGLAAGRAGSWAVAWLVERERRIYRWMAAFRPDMVVRLNVDVATALSRKPDHRADLIRRKVAITPRLRFAGAPIVDIDATLPYEAVRASAVRAVGDTIGGAIAA